MSNALTLHREAEKFLSNLDAKQFKQIGKKIFSLISDSEPIDSRHLTGHPGFFRTTSGEFRVIYTKKDSYIQIVAIGKRNDDEVYQNFQRRT